LQYLPPFFKPDEAVQNAAIDPDEDDLQGDGDKEKDLDGEDWEMKDAEDPNPPNSQNSQNTSNKALTPPQNMSSQKLASLVEEGLDMACEQLFNEISIKVMLEPDDGPTRENYSPLTEEELAAINARVDSPNKIHPSSVFGLPLSEISVVSADAGDL
jgi:hypothetical protein